MGLIQVTKENEKYYTKEFVRGFNLGAETQYKIDANAVEHGHWAEAWKGNWHCCSICNRPPLNDGRFNDVLSPYCPWCGAKMDEAEE